MRVNDGGDATDRLGQLAEFARDLGAGHVLAEAVSLAERLTEGRFYVACVGQFKRGKSTLLNALIGHPVLPTGVAPVTSLVTVVRYAGHLAARVRQDGGTWREIDPASLADYVSEVQNPENRKRIDRVEVFSPSPLLAAGMCFVDTPGIGSVFSTSTKMTRDFVPHIDVGLVVLGADPPISGEELALIEEVASQTDRLVFVLNKADRLPDAERREAREFIQRILKERLGQPIGPFFEVSATERLFGHQTRDWRALEAELEGLVRDSGAHLIRAAAKRGIARLVDRLLHAMDEQRDALLRPLDESERRVTVLRQSVDDAERALRDLGPLFTAEADRIARSLDSEKNAFLERALPDAISQLERLLPSSGARPERLRRVAMEEARELARRLVEQWLRHVEPMAEKLYGQTMERFIELANGFLRRLETSGEPTFARLPAEVPRETSFRARRRFYFTDLLVQAGRSPFRGVLDLVRLRRGAIAAVRRDIRTYLERLLETNSARVANDLRERLLESRRSLESELIALLREISASAEQALERARQRHAEGADRVRAEIARLDSLRTRVGRL